MTFSIPSIQSDLLFLIPLPTIMPEASKNMTINTEELITLLNYAMAIQREQTDVTDELLTEVMNKLSNIEYLTRRIAMRDSDLDSESEF